MHEEDVRGASGKFLAWHHNSQCDDKMLSNNTFLETRFQRLLDGLFFCRKGTRRARAACAQNE